MTFRDLNIIDPILKSIAIAGYKEPTPIQTDAIPVLLSKKDILGSAQTGTGKTAAFAIPILQNLYIEKPDSNHKHIRALILTPTRELASQIYENFTLYAKFVNQRSAVIYGGVSQKKQEEALAKGVDVLIATPGRLLDLMFQGFISLQHVSYLVLDEADRMLDMGFIKDVNKIIEFVPKARQTMLFSATMPKEIETLSKTILNDPVRVSIVPVNQTIDIIEQSIYHVNKGNKTKLLVDLITSYQMKSVLVFMRTKHTANKLVTELLKANVSAEPIHGNKSQSARERALLNFKKGKTQVLVATDIAARGIDIEALSFVVNYDLPETPETYIHRIGRTGRAGLDGKAISLCDPKELSLLKDIEKHIKMTIPEIAHVYPLSKDMSNNVGQPKAKSSKSNTQPKSKAFNPLKPNYDSKPKTKTKKEQPEQKPEKKDMNGLKNLAPKSKFGPTKPVNNYAKVQQPKRNQNNKNRRAVK